MKIDHSAHTATTDRTMTALQDAQRQPRFEHEADSRARAKTGGRLPTPRNRPDDRPAVAPRFNRRSQPQFKAPTALHPVDAHQSSDDDMIFHMETDSVSPERPDAAAEPSPTPLHLLFNALPLSKPFKGLPASRNVQVPHPETTQEALPSSPARPASFYASYTNSHSRELYNPFTTAAKAAPLPKTVQTSQERSANPVVPHGYDDDLIFQFDADISSHAHHHVVNEEQHTSHTAPKVSTSPRHAKWLPLPPIMTI